MATRDIKSVTVRADGWTADVVIEGWAGKAGTLTYSYGDEAAGTSKVVFTVVSEGYNTAGTLGTVTRTVYGTATVRKSRPNESQLDEATSGADLTLRMSLSEPIYLDDNTGAGKSGTAPVVKFTAAWATESGGGTTTFAATSLAVTNNSTLVYPVAVGEWDEFVGVVTRERVKANFVVAAQASHKFGIACVRFDATGQTSSANVNSTVVFQTATRRPKTGLWVPAYQATLALSGFTQAELIDLRFRAYPVVGDASSILDTNSYTTSADEGLGRNKSTITCDKSNALDNIKTVATTGNDTTGNGSSGNPYATIGKAIGVGANVVELKTGTYLALGSAPATPATTEWVVIRPEAGLAPYSVTVNIDSVTKATGTNRLKYTGVTVGQVDTSSWLDGGASSRHLWFEDCRFNKGAVGESTTLTYRFDTFRLFDASFANRTTKWALGEFSTSAHLSMLDGVDFGQYLGSGTERYLGVSSVKACLTGNMVLWPPTDNNTAPDVDNFHYINNWIRNVTNDTCLVIGVPGNACAPTTGVAIIGNIFEYNHVTAQGLVLWGDSCANNSNHVILWHNTLAGERANIAYNDVNNQSHTNWSVKFNSFKEANIKSDIFANNGANVGNWPCLYGVGFEGNRSQDSIGFGWEYGGRDCPTTKWPSKAVSASVLAVPNYNRDDSAFTTDIGFGDYLPIAPSDLASAVPPGRKVISHYLNGMTGTAAGAIPLASSGGGTRVY